MSKLRTFPKDWWDMPINEIEANVKYLQKHFYKYPISFPNDDQINIGKDVIIEMKSSPVIITDGHQTPFRTEQLVYNINGYEIEVTHMNAQAIRDLWYACKSPKMSFIDKILYRYKLLDRMDATTIAYIAGAATTLLLSLGIDSIQNNKQTTQDVNKTSHILNKPCQQTQNTIHLYDALKNQKIR